MTYQSPQVREQLQRKAAADEAVCRVEAAGGAHKMPYSKALHDVHRERGIRITAPASEPERTKAARVATRIPTAIHKDLVAEVVQRVERAGGAHKYSFEQARADVFKERNVPSEASTAITPAAVQAAYRVRNWHPLPEGMVDLVRVICNAGYPMPYRILALSQLRTDQGDDAPTCELDVRRFAQEFRHGE